MKKHKSPSDLNTRLLRANVDTYLIVKGLSRQLNITMADALDKLIIGQDHKEPVSPAQIRMPVTMAESIPVTTAYIERVKSSVALPYRPEPVLATNGSKGAAFRIRPKGVRHD